MNMVKEENKEFIFHTKDFGENQKNIWLLDSGATNHICCQKNMFKAIKHYNSVIKVGDGREVKVKGIGTVKLKIWTKNQVLNFNISDTLFVPDLSVNLISIVKLSKKGYEVIFKKDKFQIVFEDLLVAEAYSWHENNNLYKLKLDLNSNGSINLVNITKKVDDKWKLWHLD